MDNSFVVKSHDVSIDRDYINWLHEIKDRYRTSQIKAAIRINSEKLLFNWQLGRDLVMRKAEQRWGSGVVEQVALDLQREFPGDGFSTSNIWYMKQWYLFYSEKLGLAAQEIEDRKLQQVVAEIDSQKSHQLGGEIKSQKLQQLAGELQTSNNQSVIKLQQLVGEFDRQKLYQVGRELIEVNVDGVPFPPIFGFLPWGHHIQIISNCKDLDEALFYISQTVEHSWSRSTLVDMIKSDIYHKQGASFNNFSETLPEPQSILAQEILKDNYDFGFMKVPQNHKETDLEDALKNYMADFLLELGTGFSFMGRQREMVIAGKVRRIDMLFYHIRLRSYVVVELKTEAFEPEFIGKLNFYVNAVDAYLKHPEDNPTIGLLICRDKNATEVQLSCRGMTTPLGVSSYGNLQIEELAKQLPPAEQLQKRLDMVEEELRKKKK